MEMPCELYKCRGNKMRLFRETKARKKIVELVRSDAVSNELIRTQSKIMVTSRQKRKNACPVKTPKFFVQPVKLQMDTRIKRKLPERSDDFRRYSTLLEWKLPFYSHKFPFLFCCLCAPSRTFFDLPMRLQVWNEWKKSLSI